MNKEVYVEYHLGFESSEFSNHGFKLYKAFYGLKQGLRSWYECLNKFLIKND